ncbi:MAG: VTT domain-containing protein [Burkholderiaceae bacterium]|nr:VTT domain-containing protein [Burkholderiaceae bacterium]MBT9504523.1 VTT domain-containing protein [Burkholderiaceae bacterium]
MRRYQRLIAVALFLGLLWALFQFTGLRAHFNLQFLHDSFEHHRLGGLLLFTALFALGNLIQIPGWVFLAAAVLALGQWWGGLATYVAACVSCLFTFWLIRLLGGDSLRQLGGSVAARLFARLDAHPVQSVALLRLLFQTVPTLNYALALSGVRFRSYLLGTLVGLPLPILLYTVFFDYLAHWLHLPTP